MAEDRESELPPDLEDALASLHEAGQLATPHKLDELCARHPALAARIRQTAATLQRLDQAGHPPRIGCYQIIEELGEGGMGTVFLAEQRQPVRRRVALKLVRLGMNSKAVLARFEAEKQALAMMEHSCIARVFDAGITPKGQPFFAMEYVKGLPLTTYCDRAKLSIPQRIELFRQVCSGVQHAHTKGVVHRDLKPSNVLVTLQDGQPRPKIIDFGLAKALHNQLLDEAAVTQLGQILGTPEYMSPEQASFDGLDIDTRSDVYSLGVVLYELLTGELPFSKHDLTRGGIAELQRIIKESEPPRPSTRVTRLADTGTGAARVRGLGPVELGRELRGDLDWIVMKALEKDRTRRYETPMELAADLDRHLRDVPVLAAAPSLGYRTAKFIRRNRVAVLTGAVLILALVGGSIGTVFGMVRAQRNAALLDRKVRQFDQLASVVLLQRTRDAEKALGPPWPASIPAMESWLNNDLPRMLDLRPLLAETARSLEGTGSGGDSMAAGADRLTLADDSTRFLHETLHGVMRDLEGLRDLGASVQTRLQWARTIDAATTLDANGRKWAAARSAIQAADGQTASERYRLEPIDLAPQTGLVPIGMNPVTRLWEFYDLRSAFDAKHFAGPQEIPIPTHDQNGNIAVTEHTGIVFVLIPGGTFTMGAVDQDEQALDRELPQTSVSLQPFFLARHEVTKAQWRRLGGGEPSHYSLGLQYRGMDAPVDGRHPVENISWSVGDALLSREGMTMPTEAQWEWACRAGSSTIWWTGDDTNSLAGAANLLDARAKEFSDWTGDPEAWDDGFLLSAPVGSLRANPFGLFDVHGNVDEWCRDAFGDYRSPVRADDGLRTLDPGNGRRPWRGGSFSDSGRLCRASARGDLRQDQAYRFLGVRAARALQRHP